MLKDQGPNHSSVGEVWFQTDSNSVWNQTKPIKTVRFGHILAQTEPFGFRFGHLRKFQTRFQTKPLKGAIRSITGTFEVLLTCFYYILYLYTGVIYLKMLFSNSHTCLLMDICQILSEMIKKWAKYDHTRWKLPTTRFALYLTQFSTVLLQSFFKLKLESRRIFSQFYSLKPIWNGFNRFRFGFGNSWLKPNHSVSSLAKKGSNRTKPNFPNTRPRLQSFPVLRIFGLNWNLRKSVNVDVHSSFTKLNNISEL